MKKGNKKNPKELKRISPQFSLTKKGKNDAKNIDSG